MTLWTFKDQKLRYLFGHWKSSDTYIKQSFDLDTKIRVPTYKQLSLCQSGNCLDFNKHYISWHYTLSSDHRYYLVLIICLCAKLYLSCFPCLSHAFCLYKFMTIIDYNMILICVIYWDLSILVIKQNTVFFVCRKSERLSIPLQSIKTFSPALSLGQW